MGAGGSGFETWRYHGIESEDRVLVDSVAGGMEVSSGCSGGLDVSLKGRACLRLGVEM